MPRAVIFDLDGTLAKSKQAISSVMAETLARLLREVPVGIISGGGLAQLEKQVSAQLPPNAKREQLYLLPTSGAALYRYQYGAFTPQYVEKLSTEDAAEIRAAMEAALGETGLVDASTPTYGERIEYRESEVTLSALGQHAPLEKKLAWDPTRAKREMLQQAVAKRLPHFLVGIGGTTSIDVTKRGIDKGFGVRKFCALLGIKESDALYVGDQLRADGNDAPALHTKVHTKAVTSPEETRAYIEQLLSDAKAARGE